MSAGIAIVILAAGASSRMGGRDKLLELVNGVPLLRRQAGMAINCGVPVYVTVSPDFPARRHSLAGLPVTLVDVSDADTGMSASFRAIATHLNRAAGVLVLPGDMPELDQADLQTMMTAFKASADQIARGVTADGALGHPVVFPTRLITAFEDLTGDEGARSLMQNENVVHVLLPGNHAITDLDTPEDWATWRALQK